MGLWMEKEKEIGMGIGIEMVSDLSLVKKICLGICLGRWKVKGLD